MNHLVVVAILVVLAVPTQAGQPDMATWCGEDEPEPLGCIEQLVEQWKKRGVYGSTQISTQLSKAFAVHPAQFLQVMAEHSQAYVDWRITLPETTFTVHHAKTTLEGQLQAAYLALLRDRMIETAEAHLQRPETREMARAILGRLRACRITFSR